MQGKFRERGIRGLLSHPTHSSRDAAKGSWLSHPMRCSRDAAAELACKDRTLKQSSQTRIVRTTHLLEMLPFAASRRPSSFRL